MSAPVVTVTLPRDQVEALLLYAEEGVLVSVPAARADLADVAIAAVRAQLAGPPVGRSEDATPPKPCPPAVQK